jgi:hypothetical protein
MLPEMPMMHFLFEFAIEMIKLLPVMRFFDTMQMPLPMMSG